MHRFGNQILNFAALLEVFEGFGFLDFVDQFVELERVGLVLHNVREFIAVHFAFQLSVQLRQNLLLVKEDGLQHLGVLSLHEVRQILIQNIHIFHFFLILIFKFIYFLKINFKFKFENN